MIQKIKLFTYKTFKVEKIKKTLRIQFLNLKKINLCIISTPHYLIKSIHLFV